ncbi:MAG: glycosyltransferase family 2 protein [Thermoanaerobaculia bacterium]
MTSGHTAHSSDHLAALLSGETKVFVVVPAFNETNAIDAVVTALKHFPVTVVVVDDGSSDGTGATASVAGAVVVRHAINRGQGAALQTGIEFSLREGAAYVVTFDSDGQHRAEDVPRLLEPLLDGVADVALGSRFLGRAVGIPPRRRGLLRAAVLFTRLASGLPVTDTHNGLRAFTRAAAERIDIRLDGMAHASELLDQIRAGRFRFIEVPVEIRYSDYSTRKGQRDWSAVRIVFEYFLGRWLR